MNRQDYFRMMRHSKLTKQAMVKNASLQKFAAEQSWGTKTGNWLASKWEALIKFFKDLFAAWKRPAKTAPAQPAPQATSQSTGQKTLLDYSNLTGNPIEAAINKLLSNKSGVNQTSEKTAPQAIPQDTGYKLTFDYNKMLSESPFEKALKKLRDANAKVNQTSEKPAPVPTTVLGETPQVDPSIYEAPVGTVGGAFQDNIEAQKQYTPPSSPPPPRPGKPYESLDARQLRLQKQKAKLRRSLTNNQALMTMSHLPEALGEVANQIGTAVANKAKGQYQRTAEALKNYGRKKSQQIRELYEPGVAPSLEGVNKRPGESRHSYRKRLWEAQGKKF